MSFQLGVIQAMVEAHAVAVSCGVDPKKVVKSLDFDDLADRYIVKYTDGSAMAAPRESEEMRALDPQTKQQLCTRRLGAKRAKKSMSDEERRGRALQNMNADFYEAALGKFPAPVASVDPPAFSAEEARRIAFEATNKQLESDLELLLNKIKWAAREGKKDFNFTFKTKAERDLMMDALLSKGFLLKRLSNWWVKDTERYPYRHRIYKHSFSYVISWSL